jgi:6-phosphogluconolactonase (cycloisomerase 2 family)
MAATEESGPWRLFRVDGSGRIAQAPGSPHELEPAVLSPRPLPPAVWAQGIVAHPKQPLLYASVANLRKLVTYEYDPEGRLRLVNQQVNSGSVLPCWTEINRDGTRLYTGNAGSLNISVFDIGSDPREPRQIQQVRLRSGGGNPWNFQLDPSGRYLYMLNMRAIRQVPPGEGNTLHSFRIDADGKLSELPDSPVPVPVPLGTNPWGMAVVPKR